MLTYVYTILHRKHAINSNKNKKIALKTRRDYAQEEEFICSVHASEINKGRKDSCPVSEFIHMSSLSHLIGLF